MTETTVATEVRLPTMALQTVPESVNCIQTAIPAVMEETETLHQTINQKENEITVKAIMVHLRIFTQD